MSHQYPSGHLSDGQPLNVYLLPGLGLSVKYFDSLSFPDMCRVKTIALVQPLRNETLSAYAHRLMDHIGKETAFVLIGMSFGGVLAQEMATIRKPEAIILLSTIVHSRELPWYYRLGHKAGLTRIVPYKLVCGVIGLVRIAGGKQNQFLYDNSTVSAEYLAWSLDKILNWQPARSSVPRFQVHGEQDRLLPLRRKKKMFIIPKASHLLLPARHQEVSRIIITILSALKRKG